MAGRAIQSLLVQLLVFAVLFAIAGRALAGRQIPPSAADSKNADRKQPEWFIEPDNTGSVLIPGIGRIMVPPQFQHHHYKFPYHGSSGGSSGGNTGGSSGGNTGGSSGGSYGGSSGGTGRNYVPGGDDTLVPNPGIEVPSP